MNIWRLGSLVRNIAPRCSTSLSQAVKVRETASRWPTSMMAEVCGVRAATFTQTRAMSTGYGDEKKGLDDFDSMDEYLMSIDTTVPEEKKAHVEKLKKQIRGGHLSKRSLYRDVPTTEELDAIKFTGNFLPRIAPNAEQLIDWALSHIPERAGPRRSRRARRMAIKWKIKRADDARRKTEKVAAIARNQAKQKAHREKAQMYREMGAQLRGEVVAPAKALKSTE